MSKEIQKDDVILPGGIGTIGIDGTVREITNFISCKDGSVTFTIGAKNTHNIFPEDADFEIIESNQLPNSKESLMKLYQSIIDKNLSFMEVKSLPHSNIPKPR